MERALARAPAKEARGGSCHRRTHRAKLPAFREKPVPVATSALTSATSPRTRRLTGSATATRSRGATPLRGRTKPMALPEMKKRPSTLSPAAPTEEPRRDPGRHRPVRGPRVRGFWPHRPVSHRRRAGPQLHRRAPHLERDRPSWRRACRPRRDNPCPVRRYCPPPRRKPRRPPATQDDTRSHFSHDTHETRPSKVPLHAEDRSFTKREGASPSRDISHEKAMGAPTAGTTHRCRTPFARAPGMSTT